MTDPAWYHAHTEEPFSFLTRLFLCGFLLGLLGAVALVWFVSLCVSYGTFMLDVWYDGGRKNVKSTNAVEGRESLSKSSNRNKERCNHEACARRGSRWLAGII